MHTDTTRSARPASSRIRATSAPSGRSVVGPPGTSRVCSGPIPAAPVPPAPTSARSRSGSSRSPPELRTGPPPCEAVTTRYASGRPEAAPAPVNTSTGPVTSRLCTPS